MIRDLLYHREFSISRQNINQNLTEGQWIVRHLFKSHGRYSSCDHSVFSSMAQEAKSCSSSFCWHLYVAFAFAKFRDCTLGMIIPRSYVLFPPMPWFCFCYRCFTRCCIIFCRCDGVRNEVQFLGGSRWKRILLLRFQFVDAAESILYFACNLVLRLLQPLKWYFTSPRPLMWYFTFLQHFNRWFLSSRCRLWHGSWVFWHLRRLCSSLAGVAIWFLSGQLVRPSLYSPLNWTSSSLSLLRPFILLMPTNIHFKKD